MIIIWVFLIPGALVNIERGSSLSEGIQEEMRSAEKMRKMRSADSQEGNVLQVF